MVDPAYPGALEFVWPSRLLLKIGELVFALSNLLRIVENQTRRGFVLASFSVQMELYALSLIHGMYFPPHFAS